MFQHSVEEESATATATNDSYNYRVPSQEYIYTRSTPPSCPPPPPPSNNARAPRRLAIPTHPRHPRSLHPNAPRHVALLAGRPRGRHAHHAAGVPQQRGSNRRRQCRHAFSLGCAAGCVDVLLARAWAALDDAARGFRRLDGRA